MSKQFISYADRAVLVRTIPVRGGRSSFCLTGYAVHRGHLVYIEVSHAPTFQQAGDQPDRDWRQYVTVEWARSIADDTSAATIAAMGTPTPSEEWSAVASGLGDPPPDALTWADAQKQAQGRQALRAHEAAVEAAKDAKDYQRLMALGEQRLVEAMLFLRVQAATSWGRNDVGEISAARAAAAELGIALSI